MTFQIMIHKPTNFDEFRRRAKRRLPKFLFEYIDGGSYQEITLHRNVNSLSRISLKQRVLRNVENFDPTAKILDQNLDLPIILGPVGIAGMNARRGEIQAAKAALSHNVPFVLSTVSACSLEEVVSATSCPPWFQLYIMRDRGFLAEMLSRAKNAECPVLILTVDMPVPGTRYRDYRSGLAGADGFFGSARRFTQAMLKPRWAWDVGLNGKPHSLGNMRSILGDHQPLSDFMAWMRNNFDPSVTWDNLRYLRENWSGKLLIKGIMEPEDALLAAKHGVDGIIVSNHGGRQLDGVPATADVLPRIAKTLDGKVTLLADGGVRSGLDVLRMLALGADSVLLGRAWVYALAADGERGVNTMLKTLKDELRVAMALTGASSLSDIDISLIHH